MTDTTGISLHECGAKGDGVTNDSPAIQDAINRALATGGSVYVPPAPVHYLLNDPLDMHDANHLIMYGDGCIAAMQRSIPVGGSVFAGNTGPGRPIIDAMGASALVIRDLTFGTIGLPTPSQIGIMTGDSTCIGTGAPGGCSSTFERLTFLMSETGNSCPFYGVNINLASLIKINTIADYGLFITNSNDLNITPPYGTYGPNIQSDATYCEACCLSGYGTQPALVLKQANGGTYQRLYIDNANATPSFSGEPYAMRIEDCTDIKMTVGIDYFPSAVLQLGHWIDVFLQGVIYQSPTPIRDDPVIAGLDGTSIVGCHFGIRGLCAGGRFLYGSSTTPTTLNRIENTHFHFDTAIAPGSLYVDMTDANPVPLFNITMVGNVDAPNNALLVNGSPMPPTKYRLVVNGRNVGSA